MKLYLDEHLPPILAQILQERGTDCLTTQDAGNLGKSDQDQLSYAASHGRVLVTFDRGDFLALAKLWSASGQIHAGIILSKQLPLFDLLRQLLRLVYRHSKDDLASQILWLQNYKDAPLP